MLDRDTVMMLLSLMDPLGTELRKKTQIKRRVYRSKVVYRGKVHRYPADYLLSHLGTKLYLAHGWLRQTEALWSSHPWLY